MSAKPKHVEKTAKQDNDLVAAARELARVRLGGVLRSDGQDAFEHAHAVAAILLHAGAPPALEAAAYLVDIARGDAQMQATIGPRFGASVASLVDGALKLEALEDTARAAGGERNTTSLGSAAARTERLRRMLLAFSRDLRGVLLHLASRLQVMRWHAQRGVAYPAPLAREAMELLAPLANRLGAWSLKWELEDLAFRSLEPQAFLDLTRKLDATRDARLREVERFRVQVVELLAQAGIDAQVQGRAKHLASIWRKMQGKRLDFERVLDLRALRVVVGNHAGASKAARPMVGIAVWDTGIGVPPELHQRIFGKFVRGENAVAYDDIAQGLGLGLHVSKRLAELMLGGIQLQSAPGNGSRFTLELPRADL